MPSPGQGAREMLAAIFADAIASVDPAARVEAALARPEVAAVLAAATEVVVIAAGKASLAMARGALASLGPRVHRGLIVAPSGTGTGSDTAPLDLLLAAHPTPDASSEAAGRAALALVASAPATAVVLALISGGASALLAVPAPGLSLADKLAQTGAAYAAGAPIAELNRLRASLSAIKAGRLAAASPAPVVTLVCSDVVGDDLAVVGSGPTIAPSRSRDLAVLAAGLADVAHAAAAAAAARLGASATVDVGATDVVGDVTVVAARLVTAAHAAAARAAARHAPAVAILAGEATIELPPQPGRGGRAQQLALLVARALAGTTGVTVLVVGTDGVDGTGPAAGAIVDGSTWAALAVAGVDGADALARCDAFPALAAVGAALITGPTGVNHADLVVVLARPPGAPA